MKIIWALLFALSVVAARADSTNLPAPKIALPQVNTALTTELTPTNAAPLSNGIGNQWSLSGSIKQPDMTPALQLVEKPNELRLGKVTVSGSLVEVAKTRKPLQLVNPWAPREYGESQDNTTFSPITKQATGWKLFAIEY